MKRKISDAVMSRKDAKKILAYILQSDKAPSSNNIICVNFGQFRRPRENNVHHHHNCT